MNKLSYDLCKNTDEKKKILQNRENKGYTRFFFLGLLYVALQENRLSSPDTCVGSHLVPKGCKAIYSHIITFAQQLFARATIPNSRLMERILYLRLFFFQT